MNFIEIRHGFEVCILNTDGLILINIILKVIHDLLIQVFINQ
jgi:hypothetical protein